MTQERRLPRLPRTGEDDRGDLSGRLSDYLPKGPLDVCHDASRYTYV